MRKQKTRGQPMRSQTESRSFIVVSLPFHLPMESSIFLGVIGRRDSKGHTQSETMWEWPSRLRLG